MVNNLELGAPIVFATTLAPKSKLWVDFGYTYMDFLRRPRFVFPTLGPTIFTTPLSYFPAANFARSGPAFHPTPAWIIMLTKTWRCQEVILEHLMPHIGETLLKGQTAQSQANPKGRAGNDDPTDPCEFASS